MWYAIQQQQVKINIYAKPNAKKTAILTITDQELHISLHAKPSEGEANKELIHYLAKLIRVPKSQVILQRGENSRYKQVLIPLTARVQTWLNKVNSATFD